MKKKVAEELVAIILGIFGGIALAEYLKLLPRPDYHLEYFAMGLVLGFLLGGCIFLRYT